MRAFINIMEGGAAELDEKLTLDQARKYRRAWNPNTYKELFQKFTRNDPKAFRIYLPFNSNGRTCKITVPENIKDYLRGLPGGVGKGYWVTDYSAGIATDGNRSFKMGRLLSGNPELLKLFTNDPQRAAGKATEYYAVISRHPYDVAGMSTDRGWTSCMDLMGGSNRHYVINDVKEGTLVAYLIRTSDKNINNPLGRYLIKPFVNVNDDADIVLVREDSAYGTTVHGFKEVIDQWLEQVNGHKRGFYKLARDLYNDGKIFHAPGLDGTDLYNAFEKHGFTEELRELVSEMCRSANIPALGFDRERKQFVVERWSSVEDFFDDIEDEHGAEWARLLDDDDDDDDRDVHLSEDNLLDLLEALRPVELTMLAAELGVRLSSRASLRMLAYELTRDRGHFGEMLRLAASESSHMTSDSREIIDNRIEEYIDTVSFNIHHIGAELDEDESGVVVYIDPRSYFSILRAGIEVNNPDYDADYDDEDAYAARYAADGWLRVDDDDTFERRKEEGLLVRDPSTRRYIDPEMQKIKYGVDIDKLIDAFRRMAFG